MLDNKQRRINNILSDYQSSLNNRLLTYTPIRYRSKSFLNYAVQELEDGSVNVWSDLIHEFKNDMHNRKMEEQQAQQSAAQVQQNAGDAQKEAASAAKEESLYYERKNIESHNLL